jgi:hypothetical protein
MPEESVDPHQENPKLGILRNFKNVETDSKILKILRDI